MTFKLSPLDKNNMYHDIRLRIKEFNVDEATKSILFLFEDYINKNLNISEENDDNDENNQIKVDNFKPGGTFRRVPS